MFLWLWLGFWRFLPLPPHRQIRKKIGVWDVDSSKDCVISQEINYENDGKAYVAHMAFVWMDGGRLISIFIGDSSWKDYTKLTKNEKFKVEISVDDIWKQTVDGVAADETHFMVYLRPRIDLLNALMNGKQIAFKAPAKDDFSDSFYLNDTRKALPALDDCRFETRPLN